MAITVKTPYACPHCRGAFTKWGLCQAHLRQSGPCHDAVSGIQQDPDGLQELCRTVASTNTASSTGSAIALHKQPQDIPATAEGEFTPTPTGAQIAEALESEDGTQSAPLPRQVAAAVVNKLDRAVHLGHLTKTERAELDDKLEELAEYPVPVQQAVVHKFVSLPASDFRWIIDKDGWFIRCLRFCSRQAPPPPAAAGDTSNSSVSLAAALEIHALPRETLPPSCWSVFEELAPEVQANIVAAVQCSILANIVDSLHKHFLNICSNERIIYERELAPPPRLSAAVTQVDWEALDNTVYQRLLQQMLLRRRNGEERLLRELAEAESRIYPGEPGSILALHLSTQQVRRSGSAEVLSVLHAAAACGLVRICARLLAEGLDVNESAGCEETTALHVAAQHGQVQVSQLLLQRRADVHARNSNGRTALYCAIEAAAHSEEPNEDGASAAFTHHSLQHKVCGLLLKSGAEPMPKEDPMDDMDAQSAETLADGSGLIPLRNLVRFHERLRRFIEKFQLHEQTVHVVCQLQYETAAFVFGMFEKHTGISTVSPEAAAIEFHAIVASDFVQLRDKVQRLGNRLARRSRLLDRRAVDALVEMPPEAGLLALNTWQIEQSNPRKFTVLAPSPPPCVSALSQGTGTTIGTQAALGGVSATEARNKDSEGTCTLHIGANLQDTSGGIHTPVKCSAKMRDPVIVSSPDRNHGATPSPAAADVRIKEGSVSFLRHLHSKRIQDIAKEKRSERECWLRCLGVIPRRGARRDDAVWKKEIDRRIDILLERGTTPLQRKDFHFRVRKFLYEFSLHRSITRVSEALVYVETSTAGKSRDSVRNWPAYLTTLLRHFDPRLYEVTVERDRRLREEGRQKRSEHDASILPQVPREGASGKNIARDSNGVRLDNTGEGISSCLQPSVVSTGSDSDNASCTDEGSASTSSTPRSIGPFLDTDTGRVHDRQSRQSPGAPPSRAQVAMPEARFCQGGPIHDPAEAGPRPQRVFQ